MFHSRKTPGETFDYGFAALLRDGQKQVQKKYNGTEKIDQLLGRCTEASLREAFR